MTAIGRGRPGQRGRRLAPQPFAGRAGLCALRPAPQTLRPTPNMLPRPTFHALRPRFPVGASQGWQRKKAVFAGPCSEFAIFFGVLWVPLGRVCGTACGVMCVACGVMGAVALVARTLPLRSVAWLRYLALAQRPGSAPGGALTFFASAKESKQRKAAPRQRPALRCGQTCDGASLCAAWARATKTVIWEGLQGAQPRQGCGLARMSNAADRPKRFFAAAHGRRAGSPQRRRGRTRFAICDRAVRTTAASQITMPLHAALQWLRRRHRPRRRCLKGRASRAIAAPGPERASRCSPLHV